MTKLSIRGREQMNSKRTNTARCLSRLLAAIAVLAGTSLATENALAGPKVYWTDRDNATLSVTDLSNNVTQVLAQNFARLQDVDLDASTGILYFADWGPFIGNSGTINQVNTDGTGLAAVCAAGTLGDAVHQLALDPVNSQIYFTRAVSYDNHEVSRVNYGPGCVGHTVSFLAGGFGGGPGWFPSGLAHDPVNDILYWGDIGVLPFPPNGSVNQMTASTLAVGPLPTQLTPHVVGRGRGMALDQASGTIFLTAHDPGSPGTGGAVFAYDIALGTETQIIGPDPNTGYWDIEIGSSGQRIWYTAYGTGEIRSANFDGSDVQVELSGLSNPYGLALEQDSDGDGVNDTVDFCPGTVIAEAVPSNILLVNRWALTDGDRDFDTVAPTGKGPSRSYSTTDTAGCSCEQIIAAQGLGKGHTKFGCSISAMDDWVELVTP